MSVKVYEENVRSMSFVMALVAPPVPAPTYGVSYYQDPKLIFLTDFYNLHPGKAMNDLSNSLGKETSSFFRSHSLDVEMVQHVVSQQVLKHRRLAANSCREIFTDSADKPHFNPLIPSGNYQYCQHLKQDSTMEA